MAFLRRRRRAAGCAAPPFGYVAAAILLVKGVTVGLALLASNLFDYLDNGHTDGPLLGLWTLIAIGSLLVLVRYLQPMHDRPVHRATGWSGEGGGDDPHPR